MLDQKHQSPYYYAPPPREKSSHVAGEVLMTVFLLFVLGMFATGMMLLVRFVKWLWMS
jgi:hypothetical protein